MAENVTATNEAQETTQETAQETTQTIDTSALQAEVDRLKSENVKMELIQKMV